MEVARKNGKTEIASGVGLLLAFFDDEGGAEVYAAATKRDQARIVWDEARRMVLASPALRKRIEVLVGSLHIAGTASKFQPLGADADTLDGLNVHGAIVDEVHAHRTRDLWDVLETASGARRQPLRFAITTAGYDRQSLCWELHDYGISVLEGTVADDARFVYIAAIDAGDDPFDEAVWSKANPNLGVSVKLDDLREQAERAKRMPGAMNAYLRLRMNVWTQQASRWITPEAWDGCNGPVDALTGRPCFGGLDLSTTTDISALVLLFPDGSGGYDVLADFWAPEERARDRAQRDRVPYLDWARDGYLTLTPGNVVDYDRVREDIREYAEQYDVRELGYDRWNATQIVSQLVEDGAQMLPIGQGFASLSAPTKDLERLILDGKLRHGGHPILRWMAGNVAVEQDAAGNTKPSKRRSTERIDGIVALVMALFCAMRAEPTEPPSRFEDPTADIAWLD